MSIKQQMQRITKQLDLKMSRVTKDIMAETKLMLRNATDKLWYSSYTPLDYSRTYELIDSIDGRVVRNRSGNYTIEVFFNPELMSSKHNSYGWGTHSGFDGSDFRAGLISSIIHGMGGSNNNPRKGEATNVIEVVQQEATKYANSLLKKYL